MQLCCCCCMPAQHTAVVAPAHARKRCEKDRISLFYQVLSKPAQSLPPSGKVLATAIEYVPSKPSEGSMATLDIAMD